MEEDRMFLDNGHELIFNPNWQVRYLDNLTEPHH